MAIQEENRVQSCWNSDQGYWQAQLCIRCSPGGIWASLLHLPPFRKHVNPTNKLSLSKLLPRRRRWWSLSCKNRHMVHLLPCGYRNCFPSAVKSQSVFCSLSFHFRTPFLYSSVHHQWLGALLKKKKAVKRAMWKVNLTSRAHSAQGISYLNPHLQVSCAAYPSTLSHCADYVVSVSVSPCYFLHAQFEWQAIFFLYHKNYC